LFVFDKLLSDVLAGHDPLDSTTVQDDFIPLDLSQDIDISRIRIGVPKEYNCPGMSDEVVETWSEVADILEKAGAEIVQVENEHSHTLAVAHYVWFHLTFGLLYLMSVFSFFVQKDLNSDVSGSCRFH
jgi:Asp-tRNA(Asn)/Glu-tRNA(Gln) amidotransferase A subunit family amidase